MGEIRVLLVDDCVPIRDLLRQLLEQQQDMQVVADVGDAQEALKKTKELTPDVVLMDVSLPGRDALQATHAMRTNLPQTKVIWLTSFGDEQYSAAAAKAGASGCIAKVCPGSELIASIRLSVYSPDGQTSLKC